MMWLILVCNALVVLGSPTLNLPEKLRQYQTVTGISATQLLTIYKNSLATTNSLAKGNSTSFGDQNYRQVNTNSLKGWL